MKLELTADAYEDALPNNLFDELYEKHFSKYFLHKNYGNNKVEIFMVIICYPKELKLRKRYNSKEKVLYWDVMLDYKTMKKATKDEKKSILAKSIILSFDILDNYKKLKLEKEKLKNDVTSFFESIGWVKKL
jgi:hypothetical protein